MRDKYCNTILYKFNLSIICPLWLIDVYVRRLLWCVSVCVRLRAARDQVETYKRKLNVLDDSERQGRLLRDEVSFLTAEKSMLQER